MRNPRLTLALLLSAWPALAPAQAGDARRDALRAADRAVADASVQQGVQRALLAVLTDDAAILYAGAPIVRSAKHVAALLAAQPALDSLSVRWQPTAAIVSGDGGWGFTYGVAVAVVRAAPDAPPRTGSYAFVWTRTGAGWRVVAAMQSGIVAPQSAVLPAGLGPRELPPLAVAGPAAKFIEADLAFSALATSADPATAFRTYADASAVTFAANGVPRRGPDEISGPLVGRPPVDWAWHPVLAGASADGAFGYTIGESTSRPRDNPAAAANTSKYISVWRRGADGSVKYIFDGGNARPAAR